MRRFVAVCLVFGLIICMLGCMASNKEMDSGVETQATRIITDVWNREVEIPLKVNTIVCLGSMAPRFAAYLDVVDMMVGAEDSDIQTESVRYDYSPIYHDQLRDLPSVGAGGGKTGGHRR